jgi:di/tricarboxylate transporter
MGHQVNLMVLGPGGYRYADFLRLGLPLCLFFWAFVSLALGLTLRG